MTTKSRWWAAALLAVLVAVALFWRIYHPTTRFYAGIQGEAACGIPCGTARWRVKTLTDLQVQEVNFTPQPVTVDWLISQPGLTQFPEDSRVSPVETQTYLVHARLVGFKEEPDRDIHMVLASLDSPLATMIAEIPSTECWDACASTHAAEFRAARQEFISLFGSPPFDFQSVQGGVAITVTGVGFFDNEHHQIGIAPNGVELHPVLSFRLSAKSGP